MELPKHVCEKCYENGIVREAQIRVIQNNEVYANRVKELCINHFYELGLSDIVETEYMPYYELKDKKREFRKFRKVPGSDWKKTIIEYV